jgi:hypothetical protein
MKHLLRLLAVVGTLAACKSSPPEEVSKATAADRAAGAPSATPGKRTFGAPLGAAPRKELDALLKYPGKVADAPISVEGYVRRACSKKGCWMELATSKDPGAPACRVTFKDYGFFVPTDAAGASARLEGTVFLRRVEKKLVEHLEAEGATFASKAEDGTADEVRIVATGVELTRPET